MFFVGADGANRRRLLRVQYNSVFIWMVTSQLVLFPLNQWLAKQDTDLRKVYLSRDQMTLDYSGVTMFVIYRQTAKTGRRRSSLTFSVPAIKPLPRPRVDQIP